MRAGLVSALWCRVAGATMRVKLQVPESPMVSVSTPQTVQWRPAARRRGTVITPEGDTATPHGLDVVMYLTGPCAPTVTRSPVNFPELGAVILVVVDERWTMVPRTWLTVSVYVQSPWLWLLSRSVPDTVQLPAGRLPAVLTAPSGDTTTPHAVEVVAKMTGPNCPVVTR
jgi:hypothetical protein